MRGFSFSRYYIFCMSITTDNAPETRDNDANFKDANRRRALEAAERQCARARDALRILRDHPDPRRLRRHIQGSEPPVPWSVYLDALQRRLSHPGASMAEIAALTGDTKDTYASRLHGALKYAEQIATGDRPAKRASLAARSMPRLFDETGHELTFEEFRAAFHKVQMRVDAQEGKTLK